MSYSLNSLKGVLLGPSMENQMDKQMEHEMETAIYRVM